MNILEEALKLVDIYKVDKKFNVSEVKEVEARSEMERKIK